MSEAFHGLERGSTWKNYVRFTQLLVSAIACDPLVGAKHEPIYAGNLNFDTRTFQAKTDHETLSRQMDVQNALKRPLILENFEPTQDLTIYSAK